MCPNCGGKRECYCAQNKHKRPPRQPREELSDLERARRQEIKRVKRLYIGDELVRQLGVIQANFGEGA
jgi:hypothetical protein